MATVANYSNIFVRYDLVGTGDAKGAKLSSKDAALQKVIQCVLEGDSDNIVDAVNEALATKDPMVVINEGLIKGMNEVSRLWDEGEYYLPQAIVASDAMLIGLEICEKKLGKSVEKKGTVVTHTAEGDIHDLGQKIVNALLRANGFEVVDLGKDVPVDEVITAVKKYNPVMVTGTALMTTTMTAFEKISKRLIKEGYKIPFVCGGGAVSNEYVQGYELGVYGKDASQAPGMASDAVNGMDWMQIREKWNS
ncbi:methyltransferase cognate corrinoid protein [Thermincola ferriacetica]|uniref:Methyltransferase cognate corrinoid protein n=1 Tax=Thermincola ferriacetica TaxID=281456 RepID=A0A0L6W186_9FIRM|nr:methyltransferase cognate corrinoid protein [Thermincola ferriacetica]KNZ69300.1 methyltransferase cognate corrinoid protein [Thermincola ferriacetica]